MLSLNHTLFLYFPILLGFPHWLLSLSNILNPENSLHLCKDKIQSFSSPITSKRKIGGESRAIKELIKLRVDSQSKGLEEVPSGEDQAPRVTL